jgi:transcriptional regulator with XRE-family HTH domain
MKRTDASAETTGIPALDRILGGLFIGDNVVWHDDAGSLAAVFCLNLIRAARVQRKPVVYVSFDRSPKNLFDKLGRLADAPGLTVLDCFTHGKGAGAAVFLDFYRKKRSPLQKRVTCVAEPRTPKRFTEALYAIVEAARGDVRLVFESLTGMQEVWGGEEQVLRFYSHACPRLYELNTIAYWVLEKQAHSARLKAGINQIAQVVVDLSVKRGKTMLSIVKAEKQKTEALNRPHTWWARELEVQFETADRLSGPIEIGARLKELRRRRGLSQIELARRVGVTPSTISQIEGNLIFPSLPALFRMAEILTAAVSDLLGEVPRKRGAVVFPLSEALSVQLAGAGSESMRALSLLPGKPGAAFEPFLVEIPPRRKLKSHFTEHRGPELGHVLSGSIVLTIDGLPHQASAGDTIYLEKDSPQQWANTGSAPARLLWVKIL